MPATLIAVPVDQIIDGLNNRSALGDLTELRANILENGNIQPPDYRRLADGRYQIVAGHRRTAAMILNGQTIINALVTDDLDDEAAISRMLSENNCRVAVNVMDEARSYADYMARFGWDVKKCASKGGVSVQTVKDRLLLLTLCEDVADLVKRGIISVSYGQAIGRAGLSRNFQNLAADALARNPAPTLAWFGAVLDELTAKQNIPDDMFGGLYTVDQLDTVQATTEPAPPLPDTHDAPADGATPAAILRGQIAYWQTAAAAWDGRGKPQEAKRCKAAASSLARALTVIAAMDPAPTAQPAAPVTLFDAVVSLVGEQTTVRQMDRETITVLGLNQTGADVVCRQVEAAGYRGLINRTGDSYRVIVTPAPAPQPSKTRRPMAARLFGQTANQLAF